MDQATPNEPLNRTAYPSLDSHVAALQANQPPAIRQPLNQALGG